MGTYFDVVHEAPPTNPPSPPVTPGRIVHYVFCSSDVGLVSQLRAGNDKHLAAGTVRPAVVVRVWEEGGSTVNLRVFLDGPDDFWATSVVYHDGGGELDRTLVGRTWHYPPRV